MPRILCCQVYVQNAVKCFVEQMIFLQYLDIFCYVCYIFAENESMPVIARFYNIIVKMYYLEDEHNPPHIHARYNDREGIFNIETES